MNVNEASKSSGLSAHTIRYYDKEGLFPFIARDEHGYRNFNEEDMYWLEFIKCMRDTHMPLSKLREIATLFNQGTSTIEERRQIFLDHKQDLLEQKRLIENGLIKLEEKFKILDNEV
ncbi:MerR family transcriptional regulator [Mammaliicoccus sp. Dog046]|uniref:MerR family transcriptional regulator n=1 Tax=Mammaliicoccus sp. Dog046 TaxID=3034233 RepID=UPI002B25D519|nr:MerR family transcriptional regulator [Mammaliicoccus sp. Dog046]WQK85388.1 MerR family transcriptional regulator [Mammaliicoccus sp. Dog046]